MITEPVHVGASGPPWCRLPYTAVRAGCGYNRSMVSRLRLGLALAALLCSSGCEEGSDGEASETDAASGSTTEDSSDSAPTTGPSTSGPMNCIPGQETCVCLEGGCIGTLECVEDTCVPGPEIDVPNGAIRVIAGPRVPLESEILADSFSWQQTSGPDAQASGLDSQSPLVDVPADAADGAQIVFTLTAVRNQVERTAEVTIEVVGARFEEGLPTIDDPMQLGTPNTVAFRGGELWATMEEGFVSWFDLEFDEEAQEEFAVHVGRFDLPGAPFGARMGQVPDRDDDVDVLLIANAGSEALESMQINGGAVETLSDQTVDGEPLGPLRHLVAIDGKIYMTNGAGGQLLVWDPNPPEPEGGDGTSGGEEPIPAGTRVLLSELINPSAIIRGPQDGFFFLGVAGQVLRIPILEDGSIGDPLVYLDFGDPADPLMSAEGMIFDRANNLYVGVPGSDALLLARYNGGEPVEITREIGANEANFSDFGGLSFGDDDFGEGRLYFGNAAGRVGRIYVGLGD